MISNINALHDVATAKVVGRQRGHTHLDCAEALAIANLNKDNKIIIGTVDFLQDIDHIMEMIKRIACDYDTVTSKIKANELIFHKDDGSETLLRFVHYRHLGEKTIGLGDVPVVDFSRRTISGK